MIIHCYDPSTYLRIQLRAALSSDAMFFAKAGENAVFNNSAFYKNVLDVLQDPREAESTTALLEYWTRYVESFYMKRMEYTLTLVHIASLLIAKYFLINPLARGAIGLRATSLSIELDLRPVLRPAHV